MAAMEAANAHYQNGPHNHHHHNPHHHHHQQQPGPPLPASPTLTNPDMILPDYPDYNDIPEAALDRADHSLMMWNNSHPSASASDMHHMFVATGLAGPRPYGPAGPVTPTTPIIYGNGTMLSDIGEVTEVESTVGKPSPVRTKAARRAASPKRGSGSDGALRSSPTVGAAAVSGVAPKKSKQSLSAKRERRSSMESNSTITTEDHAAAFADFDDTVSVDDSVFQGDDEESMASSYVEGTAAIEPARLTVAKVENVDRLSTYSTTSLSRRAEEILANAKKRLTTMEGNLTRARSSLHYTSPYESDGSTPSPPFQRAATAMYLEDHGEDHSGSPHGHTPGHARMSSDVAMRNGLPYRVTIPRAQSALGAAGGYRQPPLTASKSADHIRSDLEEEAQRSMNRASSVREGGPKPLTVDEVARLGEADSASQNARMEAFLSPTFGSFHSDSGMRNPQRSSSAAQMRDIKDQMRDLKGKISNLREQARVDNLKRRSLQSLRTPSPFTHSQIDTWYEPASNRTSEIITSEMLEAHPWNSEEMSVDGEAREHELPLQHGDGMHADEDESDYADAETGIPPEPMHRYSDPEPISPTTPAPEGDGADYSGGAYLHSESGVTDEERGFHDADDDADYMSESGESLYHDSVQHQISHEDREDAFDYEHFFLHSAMGTMSLTRRASTETFTSEGSVETTRGPAAAADPAAAGGPDSYGAEVARVIGRRNSSNSISTIDTFATAQEARSLKSPVLPDEEGSSRATSAQSHRFRSGSSAAASKRLSRPATATRDSDGDGSISPIAEESSTSASASPAPPAPQQHPPRRASVIHRPMSLSMSISSSSASLNHRPSVSSFESVGTNRSFPLVPASFHSARKASSTGVLTPRPRDSPEFADDQNQQQQHGLNTIASRLMSDMQQQTTDADGLAMGGAGGQQQQHPLEGLLREDRYLVERLVASLGRCVLGLTENGRASAESRMFRRRIDAARRALEGGEEGE